MNTNLLKNSCGDDDLAHWTVVENDENAWITDYPPAGDMKLPDNATSCFRMVSDLKGSKKQLIDLIGCGISEHILDSVKPDIYITEWYAAYDSGNYCLTVVLLDETEQHLDDYCFDGTPKEYSLEQVQHTFKNIPAGVRFIKFQHGGVRCNMTGASVMLKPTRSKQSAPTSDLFEYECPICLKILLPPTSLCTLGHVVCSLCTPLIDSCPVCRSNITNIKNTVFDNILRRFKFPCEGCDTEFVFDDLIIHQKICYNLIKINCLVKNCGQIVMIKNYKQHCDIFHSDIIEKHNVFPISISSQIAINELNFMKDMIYDVNSELLVICVRADNTCLNVFVHCLSLNESFNVDISTHNDKNEVKFTSLVHKLTDDENEVKQNPNFVFPRSFFNMFADNGDVTLNINIEHI